MSAVRPVLQVTASEPIDEDGGTFSPSWQASFHGNAGGVCIGFIWVGAPLLENSVRSQESLGYSIEAVFGICFIGEGDEE